MIDLAKRLAIKAAVIEMGERIEWGSDTALMREAASKIEQLEDENRKLRSMCKAAATEISGAWGAHCDDQGNGPVNLQTRLEGILPPALYTEHDDPCKP